MSNLFAQFLQESGLYDEIEITPGNISELIDLIAGNVRIDSYCSECGSNRVFSMNPITFMVNNKGQLCDENLAAYLQHFQKAQASAPFFGGETRSDQNWFWSNWPCCKATRVIHFPFVCSMDETHHLDYVILTQGNIMLKIGQYPSVADLTFPELKEFRKVVSADDLKELRKAIGLHAQGIGVGAFVYVALKNSCLEEQWRKRYTQVLAAAPSSKRTKPPARALARPPVSTQKKPAGESYYQFCNVQFKEDGATYAYLTGGISLKAGDFVVVPIGNHQAEKLARVTEVFVCSTQNAPYPPEKTKFVLRKSERTAFPERTKPQHPAPKQAAAPAPTESKRAVPPVQSAPIENPQKSAPTVQSAITPPIVSQTPTEPEITEKKSTLSKKPFPLGKIIAAVLAVAVIAGISVSVSSRNKQRATAYDAALQELSNGNYTSAAQGFSALSGYRDAASLSVYCKYAGMYKDRIDYAGGQDELADITLQYDTSWQQDVDALETRVKGYKAEKNAAEEAERQRIAAENAAKREQSLKDQYSGKLPVEGMPVSCLKYTSLGEPDKRLNCKNFEKLEQNQKYFNVYWYDENGEMIAAGMCAQWKNDSEYMLKSFSQYYPSGGDNGQTFNYGNGGSNSGSLRDDYDNPEDLWADNQDWYEDEDEAWDEWENG